MKKEAGIVQKKEVKAILFDLDGVLVNSIDAWFNVFNDTRKHFGLKPVSNNKFVREFGSPIERDAKKYFKGRTIEEVKNVYNANFRKRKRYVKLFPQSVAVL